MNGVFRGRGDTTSVMQSTSGSASSTRNYPLLLSSQFLGALGDNMILMVILGQLTFKFQAGEITEQTLGRANAIYTSLLFIPYFLLAPLAGYLNDRFPKTRWLAGGNALKLCGTILAAVGLMLGMDWQGWGYLIVGVGACVYSPGKYGILPEILPAERLVKANGTVEMLTLVAILMGNIAGAKLIDSYPALTCYTVLLAVYGLSFALNLFMTPTPSDTSVRFKRSIGEFFEHFVSLMRLARLGRILLGTALFWVCGAVMKMNFQPWGLKTLGLASNTGIALLGLWLSVGIMVGSVLAGQMHRVSDLSATRKYGFALGGVVVLLGLLGYAPTLLEWHIQFNFLGKQVLPAVVLLVGAGVVAGLFLIPLNAALQAESDPKKLGKTIATQNFLENLAMSIGGGMVLFATNSGASAPLVFLGLAVFVCVAMVLLRFPVGNESETKGEMK